MTALGYLLVGATAGTLAGLLGIGGGALLVPLLILGFKFPTKQAVAISLSSMVFTATAGALAHLREGNLTASAFKYAVLIGLGAAAGAVLGAHISTKVSSLLIRRLFAAFLIIVAVRLAVAPREKGKPPPKAGAAKATAQFSSKEKAKIEARNKGGSRRNEQGKSRSHRGWGDSQGGSHPSPQEDT